MCLCKHVLLFLGLSENNPKNFFFLFKEKHSYQNLIYYTLEKKNMIDNLTKGRDE